MNCDNLNKWLLFAIGLVAIGDVLAFFIELVNQQCEKKDESERKKTDENISKELNRLTTENKELWRELAEIREMLT